MSALRAWNMIARCSVMSCDLLDMLFTVEVGDNCTGMLTKRRYFSNAEG